MDHEDGDGDGASRDGDVDGDSRGGTEEPSGGDSGGISPLRSSPAAAFCLSVSGFCVFPPPPCETTWGALYIGVFRSKGSFGKKDRRQWIHEGQKGGSHAAKESGRVGLCLWAFGPPLFLLPSLLRFLPSKKCFP